MLEHVPIEEYGWMDGRITSDNNIDDASTIYDATTIYATTKYTYLQIKSTINKLTD